MTFREYLSGHLGSLIIFVTELIRIIVNNTSGLVKLGQINLLLVRLELLHHVHVFVLKFSAQKVYSEFKGSLFSSELLFGEGVNIGNADQGLKEAIVVHHVGLERSYWFNGLHGIIFNEQLNFFFFGFFGFPGRFFRRFLCCVFLGRLSSLAAWLLDLNLLGEDQNFRVTKKFDEVILLQLFVGVVAVRSIFIKHGVEKDLMSVKYLVILFIENLSETGVGLDTLSLIKQLVGEDSF